MKIDYQREEGIYSAVVTEAGVISGPEYYITHYRWPDGFINRLSYCTKEDAIKKADEWLDKMVRQAV